MNVRWIVLLFLLGCCGSAEEARALQRGRSEGGGRGHTLFGDLKVEGAQGAPGLPLSFTVILYDSSGNVFYRQTLPNNGRYRILNVPNGEWDIAVEVENEEIVRSRFILNEREFTDIRRDLALQWQARAGGSGAGKSAVIPLEALYRRSSQAADLFRQALDAEKAGDHAKAGALLQNVVDKDPADFQAQTELGTVQFRLGKLKEAEKSYRAALEANGAYLLAMVNLGKLQVAQKNFEEALKTLGRAVEIDPKSAEAQFFLGESYLQVRKGGKAVVHLNEALRLDPVGKADAHLRLAALYNAANMKDRAAAEYEQFLAKKPDHPDRKKLEQYIRNNKTP